jgi:hypothetical protein
MPAQEELNELFEYRDGMLFWKAKTSNRVNIKIGARAGTQNMNGYRQVRVYDKTIWEHRIIWTMLNGQIPDGIFIDHKDRNPINNHIENLRLATKAQNCHNSAMSKNNQSGIKGVTWCKVSKCWRARAIGNGVRMDKFFKSKGDAQEAYKTMITQLHGSFANFG